VDARVSRLAGAAVAEETVAAEDGFPLGCRFFMPPGEVRGAVLVVPAMGCRQEFYAPLARWLAGEGFLTATFDYRGTGRSVRGPLRRLRADIFDWARLDCAAALEALRARAAGVPLSWIGHSLGGQILPLVPDRTALARVVTVACGSGYWRENAPGLKRVAWWVWYVAAPLGIAAAGYFPGRRLRKVGDLPAGVMWQWRRWCLHPDYAVGVEGEAVRRAFAEVRTPLVSLSFTDDEFMSARNTESLHGFYTGATRSMKRLSPADAGGARIGHFGFFREPMAEPLWRQHLLPELPAR
jgi:predicted alpha/beta hydrolase